MNTSRYAARVMETRYVWGPTVESCMEKAMHMQNNLGWRIEGNPAPMTLYGEYGTGVAISRENDA